MSRLEPIAAKIAGVFSAQPNAVRVIYGPDTGTWRGLGSGDIAPLEPKELDTLLAAAGEEPIQLSSGVWAYALGERVMVLAAPKVNGEPFAAWESDERLTTSCAHLLHTAQATQRNVLFAGPWDFAMGFGAQWCAGASNPFWFVSQGAPAPTAHHHGHHIVDSVRVGADAIAALHYDWPQNLESLSRHTGVAAWLDAQTLERALVRFEFAVGGGGDAVSGAMSVLSAVDLVVVMSPVHPIVQSVCEITMTEDGYRPVILFERTPRGFEHVSPPTFVQEMGALGFGESMHVLQALQPQTSAPAASVEMSQPSMTAPRQPSVVPPAPDFRPQAVELPPEDAPEPGWELDQPGTQLPQPTDVVPQTAGDAALAATFGLDPPRPPAGVQIPESAHEAFQAALAAAREVAKENLEAGDEEAAEPNAPSDDSSEESDPAEDEREEP